MEKYAKVINEETKEVSIAVGENPPEGYTLMEVERCWNGNWYVEGYAPEQPAPTYEEQKENRKLAFTEEADPLRYNYDEDCARYGYDSEQALASKELWLAKKDEIRERYPYPEGEEDAVEKG